jgi:transglutaminase-like putative cysteine protease
MVAISVLTAWAAGLAVLFVRELNPSPAARLADVALRVTPITTYYRVEDAGRHVGFASIAIDTVPHALQVTEYLVTESATGARLTDQLTVRLSRGLAMKEYESTSTRDADTTRISGQLVDSTLIVTSAGAKVDTVSFSPPAFAGVIRAMVAVLLDEPDVGSSSALRIVDPATGKTGTRTMRVDAESLFVVVDSAVVDSSGRWFAVHKDTVRAWRLMSEETPPFDAWVDAQGLVVESRLTSGLKLRRTAFELAFENWRLANPERAVSARGDGRVVSGTWLASGTTRPVVILDSLRVRFGASIPREFSSRFGRYYRPGGLVTYGRMAESRLEARYSLPTTAAWRKVFNRELSPGPSIESDDPRIAQRASRLAGNEQDPTEVARRIVAWVHDSLRAQGGMPNATASGAIARLAGDAREFALVAAALARAAGIPAHPVSGLLQHEGRFYLHSWTEIYIGRWIPVDAMLNQVPADASHLSFLAGAADASPDLARILSRLPITVIGTVSSESSVPRQPSAVPK